MVEDLPRSWLMGFIRGQLPPRKQRTLILHLMRGCERCDRAMSPVTTVMFRPGRAVEPASGGSEYNGPIDRAMTFVLERSRERSREREAAEEKIQQLILADWRVCIESRSSRGFWDWGLCEALLDKGWNLRHEDSREMIRIASLGREAADRLDARRYGEAQVADMRSRAWGEYANACRVNDDLVQADWSLSRALELFHQGTGSQVYRARLSEIAASILSHRRQFTSALRALDLAYLLYINEKHLQDAARVLIGRGIYTGRSGDPELGIQILARALSSEKFKDRDPKLTFMALHNILLFRVERGEFQQANIQLFEMRGLYARHAGAVDSVKLRWIEARIASGLGEDQKGERAFRQICEEFNRRGQFYHAGIASLELASIRLRQGQLNEVKQLVQEVLTTFRARYVAREAVAALLMLRDAVEKGEVTGDLIQSVASLLELHHDDPKDAITLEL